MALETLSCLRHSGSVPDAFGPNDQVTGTVGGRERHKQARPEEVSRHAGRQDVLQTGGLVCSTFTV